MNHDEQAEPLLPCPFCNGPASGTSMGFTVTHERGCFMGWKYGNTTTIHEMAPAWNTRTTPPVTSTEGEFCGLKVRFNNNVPANELWLYDGISEEVVARITEALSHQAQRQAVVEDSKAFLIRCIETCEDAGMRKAFAERLASLSPPAAIDQTLVQKGQ